MTYVDLREVVAALRDIHFPASKEQVLRAARAARASGPVMAALAGIPDRQYNSRHQVARSVQINPANRLSPAPPEEDGTAR